MALIKCRECGKEISDQAEMCPNCGYKLKVKKAINNDTKSTKKRTGSIICLVGAIIYLLLGITMLVMLNTYTSDVEEDNTPTIEVTPKYDFSDGKIHLSPETSSERKEREEKERKESIENQEVREVWNKCACVSVIISCAIIILAILSIMNKLKISNIVYGLIMFVLSIILVILSGVISYCCFFIFIIAPICSVVGSIIIMTDRGTTKNEIETTN